MRLKNVAPAARLTRLATQPVTQLVVQIWVVALAGFIVLAGQQRSDDEAERGEITSTVAVIAILVVGALAAGAIVVSRMRAHATAIPTP